MLKFRIVNLVPLPIQLASIIIKFTRKYKEPYFHFINEKFLVDQKDFTSLAVLPINMRIYGEIKPNELIDVTKIEIQITTNLGSRKRSLKKGDIKIFCELINIEKNPHPTRKTEK